MKIAAELMTEDSECSGGVAKLASDDVGRPVFKEIGSQRLILALLGVRWFEEEPPAFC